MPMGGSWNGGLLATAGGLVFGGGADGLFGAYDAKTGAKLWSIDLKTGILAPPMSYAVDGQQYVARAGGMGRSGRLVGTQGPDDRRSQIPHQSGSPLRLQAGRQSDRRGARARGHAGDGAAAAAAMLRPSWRKASIPSIAIAPSVTAFRRIRRRRARPAHRAGRRSGASTTTSCWVGRWPMAAWPPSRTCFRKTT